MIVKDEAHIIHESLTATLPLIDTYCIVDTGSSDDTIQKIRDFYSDKGISGEVHERPWKNFGHNRSEALKLCDGKMDYILVIDADDLMGFPPNGKEILTSLLEKESPNGAQLIIKQNTIEYWRSQIFKANDDWKYVGVLHEYPTNGKPNCKQIKLPKEFWMESRRLGGRNREGNKMERDIAVLTKGLEDEPDNDRYVFYLAQSYKDNGNFEQALKYYKKRFKIGRWAEEAWYSAYRVGECYKMLKNIPKFEYWMQKAHAFRPWRAEPIYQLTEFFRVNSQLHKAYHYAQIGRKIGYPKDDVLFVEKFPHEGGFDYECSILDYYIQSDKKIGLRDSITYLLKRGDHITNVISNMKFYIKPIEAVKTPLNIPHVFGEDFRPSAVSVLDYPLANIRFVNYLPPLDGGFRTKNGEPIQTMNAYINIETKEVVKLMSYDGITLPKFPTTVKGLEDVRISRKDGELWFTATNNREYDPNTRVMMGKYDFENGQFANLKVLKSPKNSACEKNWLPIHGTNTMIYNWHPYTLVDTDSNIVLTVSTPPLFSLFRGSTPPVKYTDDTYICLVHIVEYARIRNYYHCFVQLDKNYKPIKITLPFVFNSISIEYCLSMRKVDDKIECFPGFMESNPHKVSINTCDLEWVAI
jgi:glycosyltransferase involved in cell wall biosynthesis